MKERRTRTKTIMLLVVLAIVAAVCLAGCGEGNVTPDLSDAAYQAEKVITERKLANDIPEFWDSAYTATGAVKGLLGTGSNYTLDVQIAQADGSKFEVKTTPFRLQYINDVWKDLAENQILDIISSDALTVQALDTGGKPVIKSSILQFTARIGLVGSDIRDFSVVDIENDGKWDYVAEGRLFFTDAMSTTLKDNDGNALPIGLQSNRETSVYSLEGVEPQNIADLVEITQS